MSEHCDCREKGHDGRAEWGAIPGSWQHEPDREDFEHAGFVCFVHRGPRGHWCGYVGVPEGHPCYGKGMQDEPVSDLDVHGGVTYGSRCSGHICHVPKPGQPDDVWWIGFDCSHAWDRSPHEEFLATTRGDPIWRAGEGETYKTVEYVLAETKRLAEQMARL